MTTNLMVAVVKLPGPMQVSPTVSPPMTPSDTQEKVVKMD